MLNSNVIDGKNNAITLISASVHRVFMKKTFDKILMTGNMNCAYNQYAIMLYMYVYAFVAKNIICNKHDIEVYKVCSGNQLLKR